MSNPWPLEKHFFILLFLYFSFSVLLVNEISGTGQALAQIKKRKYYEKYTDREILPV
jgi:hypothetical protein